MEYNASHDGVISAPVLVIDDEADYASVNTRKKEDSPAEINKRIRSLLPNFATLELRSFHGDAICKCAYRP